ncbi:3-oxoacyl-(acyl carrier protein) synthase III [Gluconobacter thailandicus F149-1 = NBRC 100600]|uniref:Beta-ketoacyl-[acyl-carrier-protein] synthase III n=1 Tax=Gluconobacter thailandicus NBRC 3257 TaxID=1381097 RepID=A0ABQ0ISH2_GLUTH|nr:beta-ketoacyl-ACP synthase III [Gluconobacter thailandicus]KXV53323.1 3-oxoacyl-ACP synthase [Gluconobacter thailandicus]GAC88401.1 3-oxoacyl-ACP synthase [Gluconobacter thailandicus NBRC 3255]GAD25153.1 3-oxoacyl-ACP synthase [Gluconobacter thailandicus NBRC 3257]GAN94410.1 3-oxoacyl-(acyl carrier protein) synthase III [Gluconobacter thailandicus F149-1 = NBRC 100600]GBR59103.1 3-oxoacyl-ACP synthase [Gluconobacter thailandicus F149-1 = NBRC 100600]
MSGPIRARLTGVGGYLPRTVVTNDDLAQKIDTSDEWIRTRTGITQRHIVSGDETTASMAAEAARQALEQAGVNADEVDAILVATSTPDQIFPAVATQVQALLGITRGFGFDISAACSGFVYALASANSFIQSGLAKKVLVIGSEVFSRLLDWNDRTTCVLFGDGAGAVLLEAGAEEGEGVLSTHLHSDGRSGDILYVDGAVGCAGTTQHLKMLGREVFRHAVVKLSQAVDEALEANNLTGQDIQWLVPHQANLRIIDGMAKKLALPADRVVVTVDRHANTSAASIPLALNEAVRDGRIQKGDLVLMEALGGGLTWGSALVRM